MSLKTLPFDPAEFLDTPEAVTEYLAAAFEANDPAIIADAIGVAARAHGMTRLAKDADLSRQALYRALSATGRPELPTLVKVLRALGVRLAPVPLENAGVDSAA